MSDLVCWFDNPPGVSRGVFNAVASKWPGRVYYISVNETRAERKRLNWDAGDYGRAELIVLSRRFDKDKFVDRFIDDHLDDIHIFNGYKMKSSVYLHELIRRSAKPRIVVWTERPSFYGRMSWLKALLLGINHSYYARKYRNHVSALLSLGTDAVEVYKRYGWPAERVFPFMYVPPVYDSNSDLSGLTDVATHSRTRFVYVGRLSAATKGVDVLLAAFDRLADGDNWELDLVGGYGDLASVVQEWTVGRSNVRYCGSWPFNETVTRLKNYDVCIVPSRYEGWNVTTNLALIAGIGVIATDNAGSNELIEASGAGLVIRSGSIDALERAIGFVLSNPDTVEEWKRRAKQYAHRISPEVMGDYFINVLRYVFEAETEERPVAPWL